ncbi:hypothetical protein Nepgr_023190 [Nepenthes gracilis]|uniref:Uncharacterized protein n=1 Tax=Nepenthes gracilis TaxID=150966 RepID=A0AAD3T090_NEPGR|nr:hypothetical protein Nepgr_023190 [Nepenthes gracilis]
MMLIPGSAVAFPVHHYACSAFCAPAVCFWTSWNSAVLGMDVLLPGADLDLLPFVTTLWLLMVAGLLLEWLLNPS